jgi:hypothetical protein
MKYVKIENGEIVWGPAFIPKTWKNISGFNNLSPESLKELGWLPFIDAEPPYPNFIKLNVTYEINEENVVEKCEFQEVIPTEPEVRDQ